MKAFVRVLIRDAHKNLLVVAHKKQRGTVWNLPGGKIEPGENPAHAARREVLEETGLTLQHMHLIDEGSFEIDAVKWHGYFFIAEPTDTCAYNMEPTKLSKVMFADPSSVASRGSQPFLVDIVEKLDKEALGNHPWQMKLDL